MRVYTASKISQIPLWKQIKTLWPEIEFTARWVDQVTALSDDDPEECRRGWLRDEADVRDSDVVLLYAEPHEKQRGSLIEAGIALGLKMPVIAVGESPDFGTWQFLPGVTRFATLEEAREHLALLSSIWSRL